MAFALEEEEQGIAAKFEKAGSVGVGLAQETFEGASDDLRDLLGPDLPVASQAFRHLGEARDIHEHHRAVDRLMKLAGALCPTP